MKRAELRRGLLSLGIAFLISRSFILTTIPNWDNPTTSIFEELPEDFRWTQGGIEAKAAEIRTAEQKKQELILAEQERLASVDSIWQQEDIAEARAILAIYGVSVPPEIQAYCEQAQEEFNVCAELLEAIAFKESRYVYTAENKGCSGLMQVSVRWHKDRMEKLGVTDIYDAQGNIRVAADYLSELFEKYDGDLYKVLMEYNGDTSEGVSQYAIDIARISEALERVHGK